MKRMAGGFQYWWQPADATRKWMDATWVVVAYVFGLLISLYILMSFLGGLARGVSVLYGVPYWYLAPIGGAVLLYRYAK